MARTLRFATLLALALASPALAQDDMSDVVIETRKVTDGVHMLTGRGGNIGVSSGADGVVLIDDQYAPLHAKIVAAVEAIQPGGVRFVLNTHWHGDHTGGNEALGKAGALIFAHHAVRQRMSTEQVMKAFDRTVPPSPPEALPVVTFGIDTTLHVNGDALHVMHIPRAHTDGDAVVHFQNANVVHMGDTYFAGRYPFIDLDSGGSVDGLLAGLDYILGIVDDKTRIIPGHGPLSNRAELLAYRNVIATGRQRVAKAMDEGKSVEEVVAAKPLAEYDGAWGAGFITPEGFLKILYASVSAARP